MSVVEKCRPHKIWSELSPEELMAAIGNLGPDSFGRRGVDPNWLNGFVEQSIGKDGLTPDQAEEAKAIIDSLAPPRK